MTFFARIDTIYLRWALRRMNPLHADMPLIFQRLNVQRPL
jgi:hypothetical protein